MKLMTRWIDEDFLCRQFHCCSPRRRLWPCCTFGVITSRTLLTDLLALPTAQLARVTADYWRTSDGFVERFGGLTIFTSPWPPRIEGLNSGGDLGDFERIALRKARECSTGLWYVSCPSVVNRFI